MIRALAEKIDAGFRVGRIHEGGSLASALFRGGSDDGFWDARLQLDLILNRDDFVALELNDEYSGITTENVQELENIRAKLSLTELATLSELSEIMSVLGE